MQITLYLFPLVSTNSREYKRQSKTGDKRELIFVIIRSTSKGAFSIKHCDFVFKQNATAKPQ